MQSNTAKGSLSLPDQDLLLCLDTVLTQFQTLSDQRLRRGIRHPLATTLFIVLLGLLAGQNCPTAIAEWAKLRAKALCQLLGLPRERVPSRSTFERILGQAVVAKALDGVICGLFRSTLSSEIPHPGEMVVAIDGKTLRGTIPKDHTRGVHLMAAYLPKEGLVIAQIAVDGKTNEITAAPQLLAQLDLRGLVVVGDALQCQRELSAAVVNAQDKYVWFVKDNQPTLLAALVQLFEPEPLAAGAGPSGDDFSTTQSWDCNHGRIEQRQITLSSLLDAEYTQWPGLAQSFKLEQWVWEPGTKTGEAIYAVRYGITALSKEEASAARLLEICRKEWGIENGLHWRRDVTMGEDNSRYRRGSGPQVLASLRNLALGLILGAGENNVAQGRREFDWQLSQHLARLSA